MNSRLWSSALGSGILIFVLARPAVAQSPDKGDVSFGYQFINLSSSGESESLPAGWFIDVAGNLTRSFAIVGQISGNYKSESRSITFGGASASASADIKMYQFMGGLRASSPATGAVVPFGHFLLGASYGSASYSGAGTLAGQNLFAVSGADSRTKFTLQAGGGTNIGMTRTVGLRLGADYLRMLETDAGVNVFRFGAGVNVRF